MREDGYYWVLVSSDYGWEVARYSSKNKEWLLFECEYFIDEELQEIDEKRIVR